MSVDWLASFIHDVPDFPTPGVGFKDITPLLGDADALRLSVEALADPFIGGEVDAVVGIDARGFIFGAPVAYRLGCGFIPVRKPGKLPKATVRQDYALEYGTDALEMHTDAIGAGSRVLLVDDVLATGGTAAACVALIRAMGADLAGAAFLIELGFLSGREKLEAVEPHVLLTY